MPYSYTTADDLTGDDILEIIEDIRPESLDSLVIARSDRPGIPLYALCESCHNQRICKYHCAFQKWGEEPILCAYYQGREN